MKEVYRMLAILNDNNKVLTKFEVDKLEKMLKENENEDNTSAFLNKILNRLGIN